MDDRGAAMSSSPGPGEMASSTAVTFADLGQPPRRAERSEVRSAAFVRALLVFLVLELLLAAAVALQRQERFGSAPRLAGADARRAERLAAGRNRKRSRTILGERRERTNSMNRACAPSGSRRRTPSASSSIAEPRAVVASLHLHLRLVLFLLPICRLIVRARTPAVCSVFVSA